jgi:hypothetical protein
MQNTVAYQQRWSLALARRLVQAQQVSGGQNAPKYAANKPIRVFGCGIDHGYLAGGLRFSSY